MLKKRILTALVLIPPFVWGILSLSNAVIAVVLAVIVLLGAWEWATLSEVGSFAGRMLFVVAQGAVLWALWFLSIGSASSWGGVLALAGVWWLGVLIWILRHASAAIPSSSAWPFGTRVLAGLLTLAPPWWALVWLHGETRYGPEMVLFVFVLVWVADSGAYFAGRRWGRVRLAPVISPGKTREGAAGAFAATTVLAGAAGILWGLGGGALMAFVLVSIVTVVFSIVGDLFESAIKRQVNVKDSGRLLPGHGGVLDRIDSVTAAAPVFALGLLISGVAP